LQVRVVFPRHFGELFIHIFVGRNDLGLLLIFDPAKLLNLQALVDKSAEGLPLKLRKVLLGRLNARSGDQKPHPLGEVEGGDDLVIHHRRDSLREAGARWGRGRLGGRGTREDPQGEADGGEGSKPVHRDAGHDRHFVLKAHDVVRLPSDTAKGFTPEARV